MSFKSPRNLKTVDSTWKTAERETVFQVAQTSHLMVLAQSLSGVSNDF